MIIIIESPNKTEKVKKFSGMDTYATIGHFMNLKDFNNDFKPNFEMVESKKKSINFFINQCRDKEVYIATDPDREGYAIGYMFYQKIKNIASNVFRAEFHEITESGIIKGLRESVPFHSTNQNYYKSFLGRRVGDMMIGFSLSGYLSNMLKAKGLSAGRVQTPALYLIVKRQEEIENFDSLPQEEKEYYEIRADLFDKNNEILSVSCINNENKVIEFETKEEAQNFAKALMGDSIKMIVTSIKKKNREENPPKPYITSTLLKDCSIKLKIGTEEIQKKAQSLFEAGLITYIRTDSEVLSKEFLDEAERFFAPIYPNYQRREYTSKNSQAEAHEAIRITHCHRYEEIEEVLDNENITDRLTREMYRLIFKNTLQSQGKGVLIETTEIIAQFQFTKFKGTYGKVIDNGYRDFFKDEEQEKEKKKKPTPNYHFEEKELYPSKIYLATIEKTKPKNYTEASFIEELEKKGIGRPSTYSTYIPLLLNRGYIEIDSKRKIIPTQSGKSVIAFFRGDPNKWILDINFTKEMEDKLDLIANQKYTYEDFMKELHSKIANVSSINQNHENREKIPPSEKQIAFCEKIAKDLGVELPQEYKTNLYVCKKFIDDNLPKINQSNNSPRPPSEKQIAFCERISQELGVSIPKGYKEDYKIASSFIEKYASKIRARK